MRYGASRKHLTTILVSALFLMGWVVTGAAQTQASASPQEQFHKARENFLKGDFNDAAAEIRQAAWFPFERVNLQKPQEKRKRAHPIPPKTWIASPTALRRRPSVRRRIWTGALPAQNTPWPVITNRRLPKPGKKMRSRRLACTSRRPVCSRRCLYLGRWAY